MWKQMAEAMQLNIPEAEMERAADILDSVYGSVRPALCAGSARTGERTLRVSVDAALRAGIFKASGSFDPMGWSVGARRSFPRP